jgi:hypothetical protein
MFSLLTFTVPLQWRDRDQAAVVQTICSRIRVTDDAGRLGPRRIGVLLPETPADGAWKLAEEICGLLPAGIPRPECDVYSYPLEPSHNRPPNDRNGHVNGTHNGHGNGHVHGDRNGRVNGKQTAVTCKPTQPMEALFTRRLPAWKRAIDVIGAGMALLFAGEDNFAWSRALRTATRRLGRTQVLDLQVPHDDRQR